MSTPRPKPDVKPAQPDAEALQRYEDMVRRELQPRRDNRPTKAIKITKDS
jgi:hypothetical protein